MVKYDIIIYSDKSGNEPFSNWVKKLQDDIRNRISSRIDRLRLGNFGDTKKKDIRKAKEYLEDFKNGQN